MFEIKKEKLTLDKARERLKKSIEAAKKLNKELRKGTWKPIRQVDFY
jgi:hypothetical protein